MVPHGSEVFLPPCASPPRAFDYKKFGPIRSSIKNFLNSGVSGKIWYQHRHSSLGGGVPKNTLYIQSVAARIRAFILDSRSYTHNTLGIMFCNPAPVDCSKGEADEASCVAITGCKWTPCGGGPCDTGMSKATCDQTGCATRTSCDPA
ncbi:MAG: hypothetical protein GY820_35040 [Gammaproteobacteria bacterium]|nr:hypothetical protein [Gammaproteobacteria bacterium]